MAHQDHRPETDQGLTSSTPPPDYRTVRAWTLGSVDQLATVRRELREAVAEAGAPTRETLADIPEKMILVASELATNALEHGRPPTIITLSSNGECYLLDVADHDPDSTPLLAGRRVPGAGGFGLMIARRVGQDVGWYTNGTTKHIWVTFSPQP